MGVPLVADESLNGQPIDGYRPCVAAVVTNAEGLALSGRRPGSLGNPWQFPQGGIHQGESPTEACLRELREETGLQPVEVEVVDSAPEWVKYDLPDSVDVRWGENCSAGQSLAWMLLRLAGEAPAPERMLQLASDDEFTDLCWKSPAEAIAEAVPFKREAYRIGLAHFARGAMAGHPLWRPVAGEAEEGR